MLPAGQPHAARPDRAPRGPLPRRLQPHRRASSSSSSATRRRCSRPSSSLAETGCVEFLAETYYHSLAFLYSREEFAEQVELHRQADAASCSARRRTVFRNTELIYNNDLAQASRPTWATAPSCPRGPTTSSATARPTSSTRPPRRAAAQAAAEELPPLATTSPSASATAAGREWPLTAEKFARWVNQVNGNGYVVNLFMDYETFGEHQWAETGIFEFLRHLPGGGPQAAATTTSRRPASAPTRLPASGEFDVPHMISWADTERDLSAWLGNAMQSNALHELYQLEPR